MKEIRSLMMSLYAAATVAAEKLLNPAVIVVLFDDRGYAEL
jgi:hypothetical protein